MGYEGSWPVEHEHELREKRFVRDKMRKAVHVVPTIDLDNHRHRTSKK
jgi:hypothetical protein